ncbi:MAG: Flp family type IVb pilin [Chloroflexi bacterium]|nr:Flp family type IVb pilin [Chloroflexota bacterium]
MVHQFCSGEAGSDASEYALLAALIATAIIGGAWSWGTALGAFLVALGNTVRNLPAP